MQWTQARHIGCVTAIMLLVGGSVLLSGCRKSIVYTFSLRSGLADGGKIEMTVDIHLKEKTGLEEIESKIGQVRHAVALVFLRIRASELDRNGRIKTENAINRVVRQIVNTPIKKITLSDYHVSA